MTEENKPTENLDPLTKLNAELEAIKVQMAEKDKKIEESNRNMVAMMDTNKLLLAKVSQTAPAQAPGPSDDERFLTAFYGAFGVKRG